MVLRNFSNTERFSERTASARKRFQSMILRQNSKAPLPPAPLPLSQCLAKSYRGMDNSILAGRHVLDHCQIVGEVARAIILRMPDWLRDELFPDGSELIAAAHDIGKVSPTFQKKIYSALSLKVETILSDLKNINQEMEKGWGGHAGVSQLTAVDQNVGRYIPEILGQHHGFSPNIATYRALDEVFGGESWLSLRRELIEGLKEILGCDFPFLKNPLQSRVLAGLTTVSDWIGSGPLFENPEEEWRSNIDKALDAAGFVSPLVKPTMSFFEVFGFEANAVQAKLIEISNHRGVYVLEAPMGIGKTEAALYVAYQLMESKMSTGFYFALPTQLTSDKIQERVNSFLFKVLDDQSRHKKALLLHGNAWLKQFEMGEDGNPGGSWFAQGKRGILAPFAVGTIDQALMAVMNVKHGFVRTFGLAGKVVILDEVHSYDSFTGTILDVLVKSLRELHCTVIILSATLTRKRRNELLDQKPQSNAYPLISVVPQIGPLAEIAPDPEPDIPVDIFHRQEFDAIGEVLERAEKGQQVLWIENTVKEAQEVYRRISARASEIEIECGLLHSRFTRSDRASNEGKWIAFLGKDADVFRCLQGRILIGTQVLEQSLDIDADFLVTRFAPTDMLLQRIGRLWRHTKTKRPDSARREVWILAPELSHAIESPNEAFGSTSKIYDSYVLCRSLMVWKDTLRIMIPGQIRELIEATYHEQEETGLMSRHLDRLNSEREKLKRYAWLGLSQKERTQREEKAQTRYSEQETVEVLLIRSFRHDHERKATRVMFSDGEVLVLWNARALSTERWREISATLREHMLTVPEYHAPMPVSRTIIEWLEDYFYLGKPEFDESLLLRVALVDDSGRIRSLSGSDVNHSYDLEYDALIGYQTKKRGKANTYEC